jgi:acetyltransferase-like isoleucine patch superfamily enzyme
MNEIHPSFQYGTNFKVGHHCVIEEDVLVGDNVKLGHHVVLKSGTRFGNDIDFSDYCCTTGICYVGNGVNIRTRSTVSKSLIIEDKAFIGAGVMMSHTKNVYHHRPSMPRKQLIARIGYGAVVGSHTNLMAGITIGANVVVGYNSNVTKSIIEPAIYIGNPAKKSMELPNEMMVEIPEDYKEYFFSDEMLKKYLPFYS